MSWVVVDRDGKRERIAVVRTQQGTWVGWQGAAALLAEESELSVDGAGPAGVRAPMTGKIIKVEVGAGDAVKTGDLLVIMEAMKMEYRLTAPREAVVESVGCAEGDLVDLGATLVTLGE